MQTNFNRFDNKETFGETKIINSKKKGSFLEWIIKRIFQSIGVYASNDKIINNNQIDIFINLADKKVIGECKQYEKNSKPVKSFIYEWSAKRDEMKCDGVLLILWGYPSIEQDEIRLAEKLKVSLWFDKKIEKFFNLILKNREIARREILLDLNLDLAEIERNKQRISEELTTKFSRKIDASCKEEIFSCFKDSSLVDIFRYRLIVQILKQRLMYIHVPSFLRYDNQVHVHIRKIDDIEVKHFDEKSLNLYTEYALDESGKGIVLTQKFFKDR